jgi:parvulin-like peptidyl-prolyl isomerase
VLARALLAPCLLCSLVFATGCPQPMGSSGGSGDSRKGAIPFTLSSTFDGDPIATIGSMTLTVGEIENRLNKQNAFARARYQTPDKLTEFLETQVRFEVLAQEAFRRGVHLDAEVQDALKKIMVQKLTRDEFDGRVKLADITDDELKAYYDSHSDEYNKAEMMRASVVQIAFGTDKAAAEKAAGQAHKAAAQKDKLADRGHFKEIVTKFATDEELKRVGGDIRYLSADEVTTRYGESVKIALWTLPEVNDVSDVVEGKDAYYVIKKTGVRKPIARTFDQVKNQIRNVIFRDKRNDAFNAYVEALKKDMGVVVHTDKISKIVIDVTGMPPPGDGNADPHGDHGDDHDGAHQ